MLAGSAGDDGDARLRSSRQKRPSFCRGKIRATPSLLITTTDQFTHTTHFKTSRDHFCRSYGTGVFGKKIAKFTFNPAIDCSHRILRNLSTMSALWGWVRYPFYASSTLLSLGSAALYYYQKYVLDILSPFTYMLNLLPAVRSSTLETSLQELGQMSHGHHNSASTIMRSSPSLLPMAKP